MSKQEGQVLFCHLKVCILYFLKRTLYLPSSLCKVLTLAVCPSVSIREALPVLERWQTLLFFSLLVPRAGERTPGM